MSSAVVVMGAGGGEVETAAGAVEEVAAAALFVSQGFGRGGSEDIYKKESGEESECMRDGKRRVE